MARAAKTKAANKKAAEVEVTDDELDELAALEDLDEEEDEEEVVASEEDEDEEDEDEDEDDDEDYEPTPKKKAKKKAAKEPRPSRAAENGKVGTQEVANLCGIDARSLRMVLRKHNIPKDDETGRYEWKSLKDPTVRKIKKLVDSGEAENIKQEGLQALKDRKAAQREEEKATTKKGKKGKKKKRPVVEDEDDE